MLPCSLVFISGSRHSWWNVPIFRSGKTVWNVLKSCPGRRRFIAKWSFRVWPMRTWRLELRLVGAFLFWFYPVKPFTDVQYRVHIFTYFYIDVIAHQLSHTKWTSWDPLTDSQWFPPAFIDQCLQIPWRQGDCKATAKIWSKYVVWSENGTFEPKICFIYVLFMFYFTSF